MVLATHGGGNLVCHIVMRIMSGQTITIAHISDLHLDGSANKRERAARVLGYVARLPSPPDAVVLTGDLADTGAPAEYAELRELLADFSRPPMLCPGNHDVRSAFRQHLLGLTDDDEPINQAFHVADALFAMCDSTTPDRVEGTLGEETLSWLDRTLDENRDRRAFVVFHHPPTTLHSPFIDAIKLQDDDALARVLTRHDNVVATLCGHAHAPAVTTFANRPLLVAPGVSSTLKLPFELSSDWQIQDVLDLAAPPMLAFHIVTDDGRVTTHHRAFNA